MAREILIDEDGLVYAYISLDNTIVLTRDDENCRLFRISVHSTVFHSILEDLNRNLSVKVAAPWVILRNRDAQPVSPFEIL